MSFSRRVANRFFTLAAVCLAQLAAVVFLSLSTVRGESGPGGPTVLLYSFDAEGALLESRMATDSVTSHLGRRVVHGSLEGCPIMLAESGVGMTNAAMTAQYLIDTYHPSRLLFSGIAGGIDTAVGIGDIVVCSAWVHHEYGYWGKDGLRAEGPEVWLSERDSVVSLAAFPADSSLFALAREVAVDAPALQPIGNLRPRVMVGGVGVSGNSFIDNVEKREQLGRDFGALVVDMESAAVAQVCLANSVPFLIFRSASDLAGGSGSETAREQIQQFLKVAAENSSQVVLAFLRSR